LLFIWCFPGPRPSLADDRRGRTELPFGSSGLLHSSDAAAHRSHGQTERLYCQETGLLWRGLHQNVCLLTFTSLVLSVFVCVSFDRISFL